ncbi:hypothetical protein ABTY00_24140 [Streptomyces microflavus]|uniref:hypothetical protein n=1 Tax=Streptomyces microflavus TaxID=1919 RepID=UPI003328B972
MSERTLTPGPLAALADDIRDHGYAIIQTRIERAPARHRAARCADLDGCDQPATLVTVAVAEVIDEGNGTVGFSFARRGGYILRVPVCDEHRTEASHDLYCALTTRTRPDGIRAFDVPGQHLDWS